jgi:hypothetical protein
MEIRAHTYPRNPPITISVKRPEVEIALSEVEQGSA